MKRAALILATAFLAACPKEKPTESEAGAAPPPASASASAAPQASASAAPAAAAPASYAGTYSAAPGTLSLPTDDKEYKGVKQAKEDGTKYVGDGAFSLTVDPAGRVTGTIDSGPAAPALIAGEVVDGALNGTIRRKDVGDEGLTGTILGKVAGGSVEGTMKLADANALVLREAKFTAKKK